MGRKLLQVWIVAVVILSTFPQAESAQKTYNYRPLLPVESKVFTRRAVFQADLKESFEMSRYSRNLLASGMVLLDDECKVTYQASNETSSQYWIDGKVISYHETTYNWSFDYPSLLEMDGRLLSVLSSSTLFPERNIIVITRADRFDVLRLSDGKMWFTTPRRSGDFLFPLTDDLMCLQKINGESRIINLEGMNAFDSVDVVKRPFRCKNGILLAEEAFVNLVTGSVYEYEKIIKTKCMTARIGKNWVECQCLAGKQDDLDNIIYESYKISFDGQITESRKIKINRNKIILSIDIAGDYAIGVQFDFTPQSYIQKLICINLVTNVVVWEKSWPYYPFNPESSQRFTYSLYESDGWKMRLMLEYCAAIIDVESGKVLHEFMFDKPDSTQLMQSRTYYAMPAKTDSKMKEIVEVDNNQNIKRNEPKLEFDFFNVYGQNVLAVDIEMKNKEFTTITSVLADKNTGRIKKDVKCDFRNILPLSNNNIYQANKTVVMCRDRSIWIEDVMAGKIVKVREGDIKDIAQTYHIDGFCKIFGNMAFVVFNLTVIRINMLTNAIIDETTMKYDFDDIFYSNENLIITDQMATWLDKGIEKNVNKPMFLDGCMLYSSSSADGIVETNLSNGAQRRMIGFSNTRITPHLFDNGILYASNGLYSSNGQLLQKNLQIIKKGNDATGEYFLDVGGSIWTKYRPCQSFSMTKKINSKNVTLKADDDYFFEAYFAKMDDSGIPDWIILEKLDFKKIEDGYELNTESITGKFFVVVISNGMMDTTKSNNVITDRSKTPAFDGQVYSWLEQKSVVVTVWKN